MRKTALIDTELNKLNVDMACLQKTILPESGFIKEENYTFFWKGKAIDDRREHSVGFDVKNSSLAMIVSPSDGSDRNLTLRINTSSGFVNLICVLDAPTLTSTGDSKDRFYDELERAIQEKRRDEFLYILGDFNARVGDDHDICSNCIGHFGVGEDKWKSTEGANTLLSI